MAESLKKIIRKIKIPNTVKKVAKKNFKALVAVKNFITSNLVRPRFRLNLCMRMMSTQDHPNDVLFDTVGNNGRIILNNEKSLNSLNLSMVNKLLPKLQQWETSKQIVLIKSSIAKSFCAGGDVREVTLHGLKGEPYGEVFFKKEYTLNGIIGTYKIPYIAIIDGICMGGGVGLSVHGPYRICTERTLFAMPETGIGLFPDVGGSYFLPRLGGKLGLYLALTGHRLKGTDVLKAGIATHMVDSANLGVIETKLMKCENEQDINKVLEEYSLKDCPEFSLQQHMDKINSCFDAPSVEMILEKLEADGSTWAGDTMVTLNKMSPTSLKVTLRELEYGSQMNLHECLEMEYRIARRCLASGEFFEGVRALLIDKDKTPKWNPATLAEVTDEMVNKFFTKLPENEELRPKL